MPGPGDLELSDVLPLSGGVSGSEVARARLSGQDVVVKRTSHSELVALRLFADLDEPMLPVLLASGIDDRGPWIVIPFHSGEPVGIMGEAPDIVHRCIGRLHASFVGRTSGLAGDLEPIDEEFVRRALTEFGPDQLRRARGVLREQLFTRASHLLDRLATDADFGSCVAGFTPTVLHGDLYGLNVLRSTGPGSVPLIIDWNAARIGPAMFDTAMTSAYDSSARRAHDQGWAEIAGASPDESENRVAHAWSSALINAMYAGTVAVRSSARDAEQMIMIAEESLRTFRLLRRRGRAARLT
ncbi:aminoglycoside phosphotransferase family protein [Microlunatus endophyticus]|uniref:aminoglycoside phosphotransferase family protein n=1 Tax=Microlunatus endophyticus TaxID=1716077 RepID=UPI00166A4C2A|nr:aminoglycoside phosphotransferase family protein [Microlunatus endophyticus]